MTYNDFIQNILDTRGRFGIPEDEYKERHHIIPKCKHGSNKKENLIDLYPQEHYDAHQLLFLENPDDFSIGKAWNAFHMHNGVEITADEYAESKIRFSKLCSERYSGSGNPNYGSGTNYDSPGFSGYHHTEASKQLMRDKLKGVPQTQETIQKRAIAKTRYYQNIKTGEIVFGKKARKKDFTWWVKLDGPEGLPLETLQRMKADKEQQIALNRSAPHIGKKLSPEQKINQIQGLKKFNEQKEQQKFEYLSSIDLDFFIDLYKDGYTCNYMEKTYGVNAYILGQYIKNNNIKRNRTYRRPDNSERNKQRGKIAK